MLGSTSVSLSPGSEIHQDASAYFGHPWSSRSDEALLAYLSPGNDFPTLRRALFLLADKSPSKSRSAVKKLLDSPQAEELTSPLAEYAVKHGLSQDWRRSLWRPRGCPSGTSETSWPTTSSI